jgi:hypothetical protein
MTSSLCLPRLADRGRGAGERDLTGVSADLLFNCFGTSCPGAVSAVALAGQTARRDFRSCALERGSRHLQATSQGLSARSRSLCPPGHGNLLPILKWLGCLFGRDSRYARRRLVQRLRSRRRSGSPASSIARSRASRRCRISSASEQRAQ